MQVADLEYRWLAINRAAADEFERIVGVRPLVTALGFSVTHVSSADAALGALANARDIDLLLSDVMMAGGVSGLALAREIRLRHSTLLRVP